MRRTFVALVALIFSITFLFPNGFKIRLVEKIELGENSELSSIPRIFNVTEGGLLLIPDHRAGFIKIFEKNGNYLKLVKKFGPEGFGKKDFEFDSPAYSFYDKHTGKFGVINVRKEGKSSKRKLFIFDRINQIDFKLACTVKDVDGYDMKLWNDHLIISGYKKFEEKPFDLYMINLEKIEKEEALEIVPLLPSPEKYGLSDKNYQIKYYNQILPAIGIRAYIDIEGDDVYFVWEGKLRVIKMNLKSKEQTVFEQPPMQQIPYYVEPETSDNLPKLIKAYNDRDNDEYLRLKAEMSQVTDIFATPLYVFVVYQGPTDKSFRMAAFTPEGKFLKDIEIPGEAGSKMWLDEDIDEKNCHTLYSLKKSSKDEDTQILIYKVKVEK